MAAWTVPASAGVAFFPVPIAQTGSYATTIWARDSLSRPSSAASWRWITASVLPLSRSESVSPTHSKGVIAASSTARTFLPVSSSVSPNTWRRSECPTRTARAPASFAIETLSSPVNAPLGSQYTFWAPTRMPGSRATRCATLWMDTAGGKNHSSLPDSCWYPSRKRSRKLPASGGP